MACLTRIGRLFRWLAMLVALGITPEVYDSGMRWFGSVAGAVILSAMWVDFLIAGHFWFWSVELFRAGRIDSKRMVFLHQRFSLMHVGLYLVFLAVVAYAGPPSRVILVLPSLTYWSFLAVRLRSIQHAEQPGRVYGSQEFEVSRSLGRTTAVMGAVFGLIFAGIFLAFMFGIITAGTFLVLFLGLIVLSAVSTIWLEVTRSRRRE